MTKCSRAAILATINTLATGSAWIALPLDDILRGPRIVFVHRKACALFGAKIGNSDFFTRQGDASQLASDIFRIACTHGLAAESSGMISCPIMAGATRHQAFSECHL